MINFVCPLHKDKGVQSIPWSRYKNAKFGCKYCSGRSRTTEEFKKLLYSPDVELISEYIGFEKPIQCKCKKCGYIWQTIPKVLSSNKGGCPNCGKIKRGLERRKTRDQFVEEMKQINPNILIVGEYSGTHSWIKCQCAICHTIFEGNPARLLRRESGCPHCNASESENYMVLILNKLGYNIQRQYSFADCKYQYVLKFDAYDAKHNIAFEYNGEQHYRPIDFAGKGDEWAKQQLYITQQRDNAKYKYCKENHIPLIIIPYWERKNMEQFIISKLKELEDNNT